MSSRKMSLSGCRPTRVSGWSSTNFDPALGPRLTTSIPRPSVMAGIWTLTSSSTASPVPDTGAKVMVVSSPGASSGAPHEEQKFDPAGLRCPHWLQNTPLPYRPNGGPTTLSGYQLTVGLRIHQRLEVGNPVRLDHADPSVPV